MGGTATLITVAYSVVTAMAIGLAIVLASTTWGRKGPVDPAKLAHRERNWLFVVIAIMLSLLVATIWFTPYGSADDAKPGDVVVKVTGRQFVWQLQPSSVPAHKRIDFELTAADVNHGFGIYDPDNKLIAQTQVVPGKTQRLVYTFSKPGKYQVLCLEFCGFGHALMQASFTVTG